MKPYQYFWRLIRYRPVYYLGDVLTISIHSAMIPMVGLLLQAFLNDLTGAAGWRLSVEQVVIWHIVVTVISEVSIAGADMSWTGFELYGTSLMIRNLFARILGRPGADSLPHGADGTPLPTGAVISTLRDDSRDMLIAMVIIDDAIGSVVSVTIALVVMFSINPAITLGTFLPLALIVFIANRLSRRAKQYRAKQREATSQVTALIADMFAATQAIKVANAEERVIDHFRALNDRRRLAMVRDKMIKSVVDTLAGGTVELGVGLILLLAARQIYSGAFSVGDFALFVAYVWPVTQFMRYISWMITTYQQAYVAAERLERGMQGAPAEAVTAPHPVYLRRRPPPLPFQPRKPAHALRCLRVENLSYRFPNSDNGIENISFTLRAGEVTVVTGRIGAGKTTLLRTLLGLLPGQGAIYWNDELVDDPACFMVPPRVAYTSQVPRLFSETLRDNLLLGIPENKVDLAGAINLAVLASDVARMDDGLDTFVGPRGLRLSGGQVQRSAAARMFVRDPALLVFDDLSSALDVETESKMWARLMDNSKGNRPAILAVSHRQMALRRADQIIVMKEGRIAAIGELAQLINDSEDMAALWQGDGQKSLAE